MEIWKDIIGYEGCYQVSNLGNVKSLNYMHTGREKILKTKQKKNGYMHINLCKDGVTKTHSIHMLVAETFIPNTDNLPQVNHKDEVKSNNCVDNLEWCTIEYNNKYGTHIQRCANSNRNNPITSKPVICIETAVVYPSIK
jgi:hypothetical protein